MRNKKIIIYTKTGKRFIFFCDDVRSYEANGMLKIESSLNSDVLLILPIENIDYINFEG